MTRADREREGEKSRKWKEEENRMVKDEQKGRVNGGKGRRQERRGKGGENGNFQCSGAPAPWCDISTSVHYT